MRAKTDVAITGGSPNRDKITDCGGWGSVNIKDRYIYKKKLCKVQALLYIMTKNGKRMYVALKG